MSDPWSEREKKKQQQPRDIEWLWKSKLSPAADKINLVKFF